MLIDELRDCGHTLVVEVNASRASPSHVPLIRFPSTCRSIVAAGRMQVPLSCGQGGCGGVGIIEGGGNGRYFESTPLTEHLVTSHCLQCSCSCLWSALCCTSSSARPLTVEVARSISRRTASCRSFFTIPPLPFTTPADQSLPQRMLLHSRNFPPVVCNDSRPSVLLES
jgi:hypothetical protein